MGPTNSKKRVAPRLHVRWEPDYDSTWEEEEDERPRDREKKENQSHLRDPRLIAARDLQMYRRGYPQHQVRAREPSSQLSPISCFGGDNRDKNDYRSPSHTPNLDFYQNKVPFKPNAYNMTLVSGACSAARDNDITSQAADDLHLLYALSMVVYEVYTTSTGVYIEDLLSDWKYDYDTLERNHSYIQWLFPLREPGTNSSATPLTVEEIQMMRQDRNVMRRFLAAYRLMLGFYGIELQDSETGKVQTAKNWKERFHNLNNHSHNNLRITRILKCLGEMGYNHFQAPLVRFFLEWTLCNNYLPSVKNSVLDYFMFTVKDKQERRELVHFAWENYKPQEHFLWGPGEKLSSYSSANRTRSEERPTSRKDTYSRWR